MERRLTEEHFEKIYALIQETGYDQVKLDALVCYLEDCCNKRH